MATTPSPSSAPKIQLQNMDEVRRVFEGFDTNGDGKISADELLNVLKALGSDSSAEEVARVMEEIDTDNDGQINLQEFAAFYDGDADPQKSLREAFQLYDEDHDGKISAKELHKILTRLGESYSVDDCAAMIKSVDSDGDGYVCFEEFTKMMSNSGNTK